MTFELLYLFVLTYVFDLYVASLIWIILSCWVDLHVYYLAMCPYALFVHPNTTLIFAIKLFLQSQTSGMESGWVDLETPTWLFCSDTI